MSERTDITEQDVDYVLAVLKARYPNDAHQPPREKLRDAMVAGWWAIDEYRAVAAVALAAAQEEARRLREALAYIKERASLYCEHLDHRKGEFHTGYECPVQSKLERLCDNALSRGEASDAK